MNAAKVKLIIILMLIIFILATDTWSSVTLLDRVNFQLQNIIFY